MQRTAQAVWRGTGKEGAGTLTTPSGVLSEQPYSFKLRFQDEDGRSGTNPEELIAAAHAGCFTMALAFQLSGAGFTPEELQTSAVLSMEQAEGAFAITRIVLTVNATVPGIAAEEFQRLALEAKTNCPVSQALRVDIGLEATLR